MTPGGALYSLTPGGTPCSKLVLFAIFVQQTPFTGGATFGRWNDGGLRQCNFEILVLIVYSGTILLSDKNILIYF